MERFPDRLSQLGRGDVLTGKALDVSVVQVLREYGLGVLGGSESGVDSTTVVVGVSERRISTRRLEYASVSNIPLNAQDLQLLAKRRLEPRVPNVTGLPICRSNVGTNKVVPICYSIERCEAVDYSSELVEIVLRSIGGWTMSVAGVEIRLVPYLETDDIASENPLTLRNDLQSQVCGVINRNAYVEQRE